MSLPPVAGHEGLRRRLGDAVRRGRLPQSLLLHGPEGVGKQRLALWLGQLLLCRRQEACGDCRSCRLALRLEHPDLHWFFPLSRPTGASTREKLREKLEEARHEALEERRREPLAAREEEGATGIYLAAVEEMRVKAASRPAMGDRSVFVVGRAEAMVPQAASPQAANAFLKLLEEPPPYATLILTSSRPGSLLPTIRSRVLAARVESLDVEEVERFLAERADADPEEARTAALRSQGSIGRALTELSEEGRSRRREARRMLETALAGNPAKGWEHATMVSPSGARGEFHEVLGILGELLRDQLALARDRPELAFDPELARRIAGERSPPTHGIVRAFDRVEGAREEASGNVNPQAITAVLLSKLSRDLRED